MRMVWNDCAQRPLAITVRPQANSILITERNAPPVRKIDGNQTNFGAARLFGRHFKVRQCTPVVKSHCVGVNALSRGMHAQWHSGAFQVAPTDHASVASIGFEVKRLFGGDGFSDRLKTPMTHCAEYCLIE